MGGKNTVRCFSLCCHRTDDTVTSIQALTPDSFKSPPPLWLPFTPARRAFQFKTCNRKPCPSNVLVYPFQHFYLSILKLTSKSKKKSNNASQQSQTFSFQGVRAVQRCLQNTHFAVDLRHVLRPCSLPFCFRQPQPFVVF